MHIESIINRLRDGNARLVHPPAATAAVFIPFIKRDGQWHILFEKRSEHILHQPGDICFPGGRIEPGETADEAVIRELCEELLIAEDAATDVIYLGDLSGPSNRAVSVYAGILTGYDYGFSEEEVAEVFTVPFQWFLDNPPREYIADLVQKPQAGFPYEDIVGGRDYKLANMSLTHYFYYYRDYVIWGFTAKVVYLFVKLLD